jgi:hypothetical protein
MSLVSPGVVWESANRWCGPKEEEVENCGLGHDTERICCSCAGKVKGELARLEATVECVRVKANRIIEWAGDDESDEKAQAARLILAALDGREA